MPLNRRELMGAASAEALFEKGGTSDDAHDIKLGGAAARKHAVGASADVRAALEKWLA